MVDLLERLEVLLEVEGESYRTIDYLAPSHQQTLQQVYLLVNLLRIHLLHLHVQRLVTLAEHSNLCVVGGFVMTSQLELEGGFGKDRI